MKLFLCDIRRFVDGVDFQGIISRLVLDMLCIRSMRYLSGDINYVIGQMSLEFGRKVWVGVRVSIYGFGIE